MYGSYQGTASAVPHGCKIERGFSRRNTIQVPQFQIARVEQRFSAAFKRPNHDREGHEFTRADQVF
jgi:hypothetical protein